MPENDPKTGIGTSENRSAAEQGGGQGGEFGGGTGQSSQFGGGDSGGQGGETGGVTDQETNGPGGRQAEDAHTGGASQAGFSGTGSDSVGRETGGTSSGEQTGFDDGGQGGRGSGMIETANQQDATWRPTDDEDPKTSDSNRDPM
ncbi:MAG: hypothetical protein WKF34_02850 [Pyrinomonadaceae bacterium]